MKLTTYLNAYIKAHGEERAVYNRLGKLYENNGPVRTPVVDTLEGRLYRRERQSSKFLHRLTAILESIDGAKQN
jgi:hypothetical protein